MQILHSIPAIFGIWVLVQTASDKCKVAVTLGLIFIYNHPTCHIACFTLIFHNTDPLFF